MRIELEYNNALSQWPLQRPQEDTDPAEYPGELIARSTCVQRILAHVYAQLPVQPFQLKSIRNNDIYQRYLRGESLTALAQAFGLSISRVRWIIQQAKNR